MKYISYQKEYADGVAKLWNESLENWPERTGPKLLAGEDIEKKISLGGFLEIILAISEDGKVVGYCDLRPSPSFKEVCYIDTLNVHPRYQGLGIGRNLLKRIINFATIKGYHRVDAFTWSSNFKAISLYKKMGFFWQPNTSVQMVNFIPKLFNCGFLNRGLIEKWDQLLLIEPKTGPDKFLVNGRSYFPYLFKNDRDLTEIWIDKISQSVFHYKTSSTFFTISFSELIFAGNEHEAKIETQGFKIDKAEFYCQERKYKVDIIRNVITIPSSIKMRNGEANLKVFAQKDSQSFEFGIGFNIREKVESIDQNQLLPISQPQVGFKNLTKFKGQIICKVIIEKMRRKAALYKIDGDNELFTIDLKDILAKLPSGVQKIKFIFFDKTKGKEIATIERFILIGDDEKIFYVNLGQDMLIWLKECCCVIRNPGAKLIIHSHNLIDKGLVYAHYDKLLDGKEDLGTEQFNLRCYRRNDKIIVRAKSERLSKTYIFSNHGNIKVLYESLMPLTFTSTSYFMDESALIKIDYKRAPITMIEDKIEDFIKKCYRFKLLTYSHQITCSLNKSYIDEIEFLSNRVTFKIDLKPRNAILPVVWRVKERRKKFVSPSSKIQLLIEKVKVKKLLVNSFICKKGFLSLAVDPSFGPIIHSLKFNGKEILLTDYPKVGDSGEKWPWNGGLYTLGCLANKDIIDSFRELCLEEKFEILSIVSSHNKREVPGILVRSFMDNISGLRKVFLNTYYFLLPDELFIVSKFENEVKVPLPCYFSTIAFIKPFSDIVLMSDVFKQEVPISEEHLEIPFERVVEFRSKKMGCVMRYSLHCDLILNAKVINLANKKGFNLLLDIKDYFKPANIVVQRIQFKEGLW